MKPGIRGRSSRTNANQYAKMIMRLFRNGWDPDEETAKGVVGELKVILTDPKADRRTKVNAARALLSCAEFCSKEQLDQARLELDREKFEAAKSGALGEGLSGGEMRGSDGQQIEP
jgi:hypothetical protein